MKYKIYNKTFKTLVKEYNKDNSEWEYVIKTKSKYYAKRKGIIFGFNHVVGMKNELAGDMWEFEEYFDSLEECQNFILKYHEVKYGDKNKPEIIMTFSL